MQTRNQGHLGRGLWFGLAAAASFGSSGPFAKSLLVEGWSAGALVLLRIALATLVLLVPTVLALRGRWVLVRGNLATIVLYGAVAVAGCQVAYFYAVSRLSVGVALLLEYLGIVLVVLWVWLRTRRAPSALTGAGIALALAGLVLVLDLTSSTRPDAVGVVWGLVAAVGLAVFYVMAAEESQLPPVALAGLGMGLGTALLAAAGLAGLVPMRFATSDATVLGALLPWWVPILELGLVAAAAAYFLAVVAARILGSTMASFLGLTEVLFAVLFAWLLLGELPGTVQVLGGVLILGGVVAVRLGELRSGRTEVAVAGVADLPLDPSGSAPVDTTDFRLPSSVA